MVNDCMNFFLFYRVSNENNKSSVLMNLKK